MFVGVVALRYQHSDVLSLLVLDNTVNKVLAGMSSTSKQG